MTYHRLGTVTLILMFFFAAASADAQSSGKFSDKLKGRILLQVQQHGEAWYVKPDDGTRVFIGRPSDAFAMMRSLGKGIADRDIRTIPLADANLSGDDGDGDGLSDALEKTFGTYPGDTDSDDDGYDDKTELLNGYDPLVKGVKVVREEFARRQAGALLLQVEQHGEAWYINPGDLKRYYLGRPGDAFSLMRSLGLGISDADLEKIPVFTQGISKISSKEKQQITTGSEIDCGRVSLVEGSTETEESATKKVQCINALLKTCALGTYSIVYSLGGTDVISNESSQMTSESVYRILGGSAEEGYCNVDVSIIYTQKDTQTHENKLCPIKRDGDIVAGYTEASNFGKCVKK